MPLEISLSLRLFTTVITMYCVSMSTIKTCPPAAVNIEMDYKIKETLQRGATSPQGAGGQEMVAARSRESQKVQCNDARRLREMQPICYI